VHYHVFVLETIIGTHGEMDNVTRTYSRESVIETGELIKDLLRDKQIHIEQVVRCEREIEPEKQAWDCELVVDYGNDRKQPIENSDRVSGARRRVSLSREGDKW
jgi:hypothetical protein